MDKEWRDKAQCKDLTSEESDDIFFIGPGKSSKRARLYCQTCPVKRECNNFAVMYNETGIWAGTTDEDRRNLDPEIGRVLRAQAEAEGQLESRNLNDFIPQVRHQYPTGQEDPILVEYAESQRALELAAEREAERLAARSRQSQEPNAPQENAL